MEVATLRVCVCVEGYIKCWEVFGSFPALAFFYAMVINTLTENDSTLSRFRGCETRTQPLPLSCSSQMGISRFDLESTNLIKAHK